MALTDGHSVRSSVSISYRKKAKESFLFKGKSCQVVQFSNALRIIEMVPVLKKLKVWTLYVHIVAQVNHRGLGVKVETNCLRDSDLIPRHSFLSTIFSIFINRLLKFM